ncbi:L-serine ammonia-lyase [Hydrogenophaga sp. OTU3427]|uniref:L-serine ammonia-lyase n=1 Tax=Hydrogenophaga sp. OTU3427 TaxID=3043856 RepID=UPI00313C8787
MTASVFDIFTVGIGPSSSHTVGPMIAAHRFAHRLAQQGWLSRVRQLRVELYGSLGATGRGHGTDKAVLLGLEGQQPDSLDPETVATRLAAIRKSGQLLLLARQPVARETQAPWLHFRRDTLPRHPNGMRFHAFDGAGDAVVADYYAVGGGVVASDDELTLRPAAGATAPPFPFRSGAELVQRCRDAGLSIAQLIYENEQAWRPAAEVVDGVQRIRIVMAETIARGCRIDGELPGPLRVRRRAAALHRKLMSRSEESPRDPLSALDWVNLYAMAVTEENAAGGRVVAAPSNGAAGVVPAVLQYYLKFVPGSSEEGSFNFLLTAAAIGLIYKASTPMSGAELGCQGEVGVACSMAAGALAAVLGGTVGQVEHAAQIGMEHNLGMTCDPMGGLVQNPCIERNAMGAIKAINAARMALCGERQQVVSLDKVIRTMMQTGADMKTKYKEASRGDLTVNVVEC